MVFNARDEALQWTAIALAALALWWHFALTAKRYHDLGKSGAWALVSFVPVFGLLWVLFECSVRPGAPEANVYGPGHAHSQRPAT